jgi:hypothetical protein
MPFPIGENAMTYHNMAPSPGTPFVLWRFVTDVSAADARFDFHIAHALGLPWKILSDLRPSMSHTR